MARSGGCLTYASAMSRAASSLPAGWISSTFDVSPVRDVSLIRAFTNDVYLVETGNERYVLKVYGAGWRQDSEIRFEAELLDHLASRGILVAPAIKGRNGEALHHVEVGGKRWQAVLFAYAAGRKPNPPFTPEMYYQEGRAVAALHLAADDFQTLHQRRPLDLDTLIDRPSALVSSLGVDEALKQPVLDVGGLVRSRIEGLANVGLDWGVCHGDLTFDNLHITDDGKFVWYDFDSGGYGWRAIHLQGWTVLDEEWHAYSEAFLRGYREVRPLTERDVAAAPYLAAASEIWGLQIDLERRVLREGPLAVDACLAERCERFTRWRQRLHENAYSPGW